MNLLIILISCVIHLAAQAAEVAYPKDDARHGMDTLKDPDLRKSVIAKPINKPTEPKCPDGFFKTTGSNQCYMFFGDKLRNGTQANEKCKAENLRLAEPRNPVEVRSYLVENLGVERWVYLGAKGDGSTFIWLSSGNSISNTSPLWYPKQPLYVTNARCLQLMSHTSNLKSNPDQPFNGGPCSWFQYTLCERSPTPKWPYVGDGCCNLSTTPKCMKEGGECIPRNETCVGDVYLGAKYCDFNKLKSCQCCVPPNCGTLSLCKVLNGTCNKTCEGRSVSGKEFCKDSKHCKCCLPEEPKDCPCGQNINGGCKGQYLPDKWAKGYCEKNCPKGTYPLKDHTCNKTGGEDCKCCALLKDVCLPKCLNGECIAPNKCRCSKGWSGPLCETPLCTPNCINGKCIAPNKCECNKKEWKGTLCDVPICNPNCVNGKCIAPNKCECQKGWKGPLCDMPICNPICINGKCIAPNKCECQKGWTGPLCDTRCCFFGDNCYANGTQLPKACTRLTCNDGKWVHEGDTCITCSRCGISNDPHFGSWFGTRFDWHGTCSYSLAQNGTSKTPSYGVFGKFQKCLTGRAGASCLEKITFEIDATSHITIENYEIRHNKAVIKPGSTPMIFGLRNSLAIWEGTCYSGQKSSWKCYCIVGSQGLMVQYCGWSMNIWAYKDLKEDLYGMCGYFSSNSTAQFTARDGTVFPMFEDKFAQSWEHSACLPSSKTRKSNAVIKQENCEGGGSKRDEYIKTCSANIKDLKMTETERNFTTENCAFDRCVIMASGSVNPSPEDWLKESKQVAVREIAIRKSATDITGPKCPDGFFKTTGSSQCYMLFDDKLRNGTQAKEKCDAENLRLAEPRNPVEVRSYLVENLGVERWVYIGAKGDGTTFIWLSSGKSISNTSPFWYPKQPLYLKNDRCLQLMSHTLDLKSNPDQPFNGGPCSWVQYTLCESTK